jgi:hypothetical protein
MMGGYGISGLTVGRVSSGGPHSILGVRLQFVERLRIVWRLRLV